MAVSAFASFDAFEAVRNGWRLFRNRELVGLVALATFVASAFDVISAASGQTIDAHPAETGLILLGATAVFIISQMYYWPRILQKSMRLAGVVARKPVPGVRSWLMFTARMIAVNFFCWYDKKLLAPAAALLAGALVLAPIALLRDSDGLFDAVSILAGLGMLAWLAAVLVHGVRTWFAPFLFVRGDGEAGYVMHASFERTRGRVLEVLIALALIGVLILPLPLAISLVSLGIEKGAAMLNWPVWAGPIAGIALTYPLGVVYGAFLPVMMAQLFGFYDKKGFFAGGKKPRQTNYLRQGPN